MKPCSTHKSIKSCICQQSGLWMFVFEHPTTRIRMHRLAGRPGVADASDVFWLCCGWEVHPETALGWGLLFSSARRGPRILIRTHLLVRGMPRSNYSSDLISSPPHFSYLEANGPRTRLTNGCNNKETAMNICFLIRRTLTGRTPNRISCIRRLPCLRWV